MARQGLAGARHRTRHRFDSPAFPVVHRSGSSVGYVPRPPRIQTPGPYHVAARGNNRAAIYGHDDDRKLFLALLHGTAARLEWEVQLWCLMTNHYHLLIETKFENLAHGMHRINSLYARIVNERDARTGHLFERRYFSNPIESDSQLRATALYIVHNPVAAELCRDARDWPWTGGALAAQILAS
jgi:putative transposase